MEARCAEMGIRKAFGAKRRKLLHEVLFENLVLTLLGGAVGWLLSWLCIWGISENAVFLAMLTRGTLYNADVSLDIQMFFTPRLFIVCFLCCALLNHMAAFLPAWRSLRKPIVESLNQKR
jgi:putative ABC transport system permease protein